MIRGASIPIFDKDINAGHLVGPNILTCGPQLRGHFKKDPEQIVIKQKYQGFDFIKIYSFVTKEEYHTIMSTAKKLDIYTAGHIPFQLDALIDSVVRIGNEMETENQDGSEKNHPRPIHIDYLRIYADSEGLLGLKG